jgi:hypothetical protein
MRKSVYLAGSVPEKIHDNYRSRIVNLSYKEYDFDSDMKLIDPFSSVLEVSGPRMWYEHGFCLGAAQQDWLGDIMGSNFLFAFIDNSDCHGTIMEIGYALGFGVRVFVCFDDSKRKLSREMWFIAKHVDAHCCSDSPVKGFWSFCKHFGLFKQSYAEYLASDHWKHVARDAKDRAGHKCQLCNSSGLLNVHHRDYSRKGAELPQDVICLCHSCHAKFHDKVA